MHLHDNADCCTQQQQRGFGEVGGDGYTRGNNRTMRTATDAVTMAALTRDEPTRQSQPVIRQQSPPCPVGSGYCPACSGYFPGFSYAVQRLRVASIGHRLLIPRRLRHSGPVDDFGLRSIVEFHRQPPQR